MTQKKKGVSKSDKVVEKKVETPKPTTISSVEEATKLVKDGYTSPLHVEYCVLENGHVFYGHSRAAALKYSRRFGLKYFDVKL